MGAMVRPDVRLGIVRSISYGLFDKPDTFVPQLRELGATPVRVNLLAKLRDGCTTGSATTSRPTSG